MDLGIGDIFNARVAGNIANDDILGSMEFACKLAGSKVVLVLGHTSCGAIKGAIDNVELGHLTICLRNPPSGKATPFTGERSEESCFCRRGGAEERGGDDGIHSRAERCAPRTRIQGTIKVAGAMYNLDTATVDFFV